MATRQAMPARQPPDDGSADLSRPGLPRAPAVPVAFCLAAGILMQQQLEFPPGVWLILACLLLAGIALAAFMQRGLTSRFARPLLALVLLCGGFRAALEWQIFLPNRIADWSSLEPRPVRVQGTLATPVAIRDREVGPHLPSWMELDHSLAVLQLTVIESRGVWKPVNGQVRIDVTGHLTHVGVGDRIEALGQLSLPAPPGNPGEFDYARYLKMRGIDALLRVEHPAAIVKTGQSTHCLDWLARRRESFRGTCRQLLLEELPPAKAGLAASLLIGDRSRLSESDRDLFAETGMTHLLAISGMNVGVFLILVIVCCRLLDLSHRTSIILLMLTALGFIWIVEQESSVLRAGMLTLLGLFGMLLKRPVNGWNMLAVCAAVLLLWRPGDLYDIGAQLSFLAVGAIFWAMRIPWRQLWRRQDALTPETVSLPWRCLQWGLSLTGEAYLITGAIWLATVPLVIALFHLVAPIGLLLDLILVPFSTLVLWLGYLLLFLGALLPITRRVLAPLFSWNLQIMLDLIAWARDLPGSHFYLNAPPVWWTIGFYVCLAGLWFLPRHTISQVVTAISLPGFFRRTQACSTSETPHWGLRGLACWMILGLLLPLLPMQTGLLQSSPLRCTFFSVGHGLACLLELPDGQTVLYDAGTMGDGRRALRAVDAWLRISRKSCLNTVIVSHADHDHYSGITGLLQRYPAGKLVLTPAMLTDSQPAIAQLCETASQAGTRIELVGAGDTLHWDSPPGKTGELRVLHPVPGVIDRNDNANSLVISVDYAGRRILLTGDLEPPGLDRLLKTPAQRCDVLLSPHHGGRASNIPKLYAWAQPEHVVISGRGTDMPAWSQKLKTAQIHHTALAGATTFEISAAGRLTVREFLNPAGPQRADRKTLAASAH